MSLAWVDELFPSAIGLYEESSDPDESYNCIAWAAGRNDEWWSHLPGYRWPADRTQKIEALVAVFISLGYERCESAHIESGHEKVALYSKDGLWMHAARLLPSGKWASKLGYGEDIEHENAPCMCGEEYGEIHCIMRRPINGEGRQ